MTSLELTAGAMLQRLATALLLLAASPAAGGALEEPWLGVYHDPDGLTIFMRQVVTKEPGMISARSADWVIRGRRSRAAASRASGWRRRPTPTAPRSASGCSPR